MKLKQLINIIKKITIDLKNYIIVTELINSKPLIKYVKDYLSTKDKSSNLMNPTIRSKIIFGVASIMKQLHRNKIIFRDLKLEKIVLDENLEPKFLHNKFLKFVTNPRKMLRVGTPYCMAPEMFDENEPYSYHVDVYAYAFLLYKMFTTEFKFADKEKLKTVDDLFNRIVNGDRPVRPPLAPDHYWDLIQRCWSQNPLDRPTFDEIVQILRDDKFALEEFGMKTDLKQLHEYQNRFKADNVYTDGDVPDIKPPPTLCTTDSIWSFYDKEQVKTDNFYIDDEEEKFHKATTQDLSTSDPNYIELLRKIY